MIDFDTFQEQFREAINSLTRDYAPEDGSPAKFCAALHSDLGLGQTPVGDDQIQQMKDTYKEATGSDFVGDTTGIEYTEEHHMLHALIHQFKMEAIMGQLPIDQLLAATLATGRRMGMAEAGRMFGTMTDTDVTVPDFPPEA